MQALLLAAGLGTRLQPLTDYMPKCLAPIRGKPLLGIWLKFLAEAGVDKIFVNLHYQSALIEQYIEQSGFSDRVELLYEEELLGTAGTLIKFRHLYRQEPLLLIHADNLSVFSFAEFYQFHLSHRDQGSISMMTFTSDDPGSCGIVEVEADGKLLGFHEKVENPPGNQANAAVYWLEPDLINGLDSSMTDISTEVLPSQMGSIWCWHNSVYHRDIGNIKSLSQAQLDAPGTIDGPVTDVWLNHWNRIKGIKNKARFE
ncbi:MAG: nucleotidyltransferase family protein [Pseudomonadales bacterium]